MTEINELSKQILESKYYTKDESTSTELFMRVANVVAIPDVIDKLLELNHLFDKDSHMLFPPYEEIAARVMHRRNIMVNPGDEHTIVSMEEVNEIWIKEAKKYFDIMNDLDFMPGTPTLINAGRANGMLSSCFFLRVPDSMEGIMETNKQLALISKAGGGVGLDVSTLRPCGAPVTTSSKGTSSGPVSFLKVFNETGNQVQQGGVRRAALIAIMSIDHPDIIEFIKCKEQEGILSNFNISVLITDDFMKALENDPEGIWACKWKEKTYIIDKEIDSHIEISENNLPPDSSAYYRVKDIWNLIVSKSWMNGEPGVIFWDELNRGDIFKGKFGKLGVNPCGEQPLLPFESCNLAAINLGRCWYKDKKDQIRVDYEKINKLTKLGIHFLDNVIDINNFPLPEIEEWTLRTRRVGLGTMGLHDLMLRKGVRYGSDESLALIDKVYSTIQTHAIAESTRLGSIRGIPKDLNVNRRNAGLLTVQPTGTVSIICNQTSSGVEPVFQWEFTRKDSYGTHKIKHFLLEEFPEKLPSYAVTALEVTPQEHVKIQAQIQKYIDSSISKTVNLPNSATREQVDNLFRLAYKTKCKSITIYRSGSRQSEVLIKEKESQEENEEEPATEILNKPISPRLRGPVLFGATFKINTPGGKAYVTVNEDDQGIREVFIHISKAGSEITTHVEAEGRLVSHALKHNIPAETLIGHLAGHKSNPIFDSGRSVKSVPDAVAIVMQQYKDYYEGFSEFIDKEPVKSIDNKPQLSGEISGDLCPDCGEVMYQSGGCQHCYCGYSQCG